MQAAKVLLLIAFFVFSCLGEEALRKIPVRVSKNEPWTGVPTKELLNNTHYRHIKIQEGDQDLIHEGKRGCSSRCICENGGWTTPYGLYCGADYYGCNEEMPCDGLDFCCNFHDYCVGVYGMTDCFCTQNLYACSTNIGNLINRGFEFSSFCPSWERSTASTIAFETSLLIPLVPGCTIPSGSAFLQNSYSLYVRAYSNNLVFDYTASVGVFADTVGVYAVGSCHQDFDCAVYNTTVVRRQAYGRVTIPASTIIEAVPWSGYYELRYTIEDALYVYWVATSNSFQVIKH
eukprot:TRINITY_DN15494_c0_g1_i1.p1 TRINITY_DN15494_c0_g1~~TRINITY_DN15494_c0_g1_i1.p1  ORF type:complete len:307 (+),score=39.44 TRINITY_DN15494_c0_g1_i1:57-923(+)